MAVSIHTVERHSSATSRNLRSHQQQDTNINTDTNDRYTIQDHQKKELDVIGRIALCWSISQLDYYGTWFKLGMVLKKLGAPLQLWEDLSRKSTKYRTKDCAKRWATFRTTNFKIGAFIYLEQKGDLDNIKHAETVVAYDQ